MSTKTDQKVTILVNKKPYHINTSTISADEIKALVQAPGDYEVWKIVKSPDPEGQLPIDDIQITGTIDVKSGEKFRVVPPGTFGAVSTMTPHLSSEIDQLQLDGYEIETFEESSLIILIFKEYILSPGYNKHFINLLLKVPLSFPNGNMDMFWTDPDLRLKNSNMPANTSEEIILGKKWLRFSWHPKTWNPGVDNLKTYLEFVNRRLLQVK
jgi:hypothetical protein